MERERERERETCENPWTKVTMVDATKTIERKKKKGLWSNGVRKT